MNLKMPTIKIYYDLEDGVYRTVSEMVKFKGLTPRVMNERFIPFDKEVRLGA